VVGAVFVDELDLANADVLVDARPVLGGGLRQSDGATNGYDLLCGCDDSCGLHDRHYTSASRDTMEIIGDA
jgi:hypothetical protein